MTSPITLGRQSVWQAIESWSRLRESGQSVFKRLIKFEDEQTPRLQDVVQSLGPGDLPAIAIFSRTISVSWKHTRTHHWLLDLDIKIWTPRWNLLLAEKYAPEVINAAHAAAPADNPTVTFVKNPTTGTGYDPDGVPAIQFDPVSLGPDQATRAIQTTIILRLLFDFEPFAAA